MWLGPTREMGLTGPHMHLGGGQYYTNPRPYLHCKLNLIVFLYTPHLHLPDKPEKIVFQSLTFGAAFKSCSLFGQDVVCGVFLCQQY